MRNTLLLLVLFICISTGTTTVNELENTTWKGTFFTPDATDGLFVFKQDTVMVMINDYALETMAFSVKGDTLSLTKIMGDSPCGTEAALYLYKVTDDVLKLTMLKDDCAERSSGISTEGYVKE